MIFRFPGALLGFFLGSLFETNTRAKFTTSFQTARVSQQDFELRLLALASMVIRADGKTSQSELDYVRAQFVQFFGKERANQIFHVYNAEFKQSGISAVEIGQFLASRTQYGARLQMLDFLFRIAKADGRVSPPELKKLLEIAGYMRISTLDYNSIKAMLLPKQTAHTPYWKCPKPLLTTTSKRHIETWLKSTIQIKFVTLEKLLRGLQKKSFNAFKKHMKTLKTNVDFSTS